MKNFFLSIVRNIPAFLLSFIIAFFIWSYVITESDPTEEGRFAQSVVVDVSGIGDGLVVTSDIPSVVSINLRAPSSIWRRMSLEKIPAKAVINVSGLDEGEYEIPLSVQIGISPIQIMSLSPSTVKVSLERFEEREYPIVVRETGDIPSAFKGETPTISQDTVKISGAVSQLDRISEVRAYLDHNNATGAVEKIVTLAAYDEKGIQVRDLKFNPERVTVHQEINMRGGYRIVSVKLLTTGEIQSGYRIKKIGVDPVYVTIYSADRELLDNLNSYIETEEVDLSGMNDSVSRKISLSVPNGVTLVGDSAVTLNVNVEAIEGTITVTDVPVFTVGIDEENEAEVAPEFVDVYLTGPINSLNTIETSDLYGFIELQDLQPGNYQLEPHIEINVSENIEVQSILPSVIEVQISPRDPVPDEAPEAAQE